MNAESDNAEGSLSLTAKAHIHSVCLRFEKTFRAGGEPKIEDFLADTMGDPALRSPLFRELLATERELRQKRGERPEARDYEARFAEYATLIAETFADAPTCGAPSQPGDTTERCLLVSLITVRQNPEQRDAVLAALHDWVQDKSKSFRQCLVNRGLVGPDHLTALETHAEWIIAEHGGNAKEALTAASRGNSTCEDFFEIRDPDVQACLRATRDAHMADTVTVVSISGGASSSNGNANYDGIRYQNEIYFREGGQGVVYIVRDTELNREVALKRIKDRFADDIDIRARFVKEAEITGRLEHHGIVPVYGHGNYSNDRPYYAMRFIGNRRLHDAIKDFHKADAPDREPTERSLALRELLNRFLVVCDTVGYAHSRGILNRDLKPGNIMLGPFGETFVIDWGLAKLINPVHDPDAQARPPLRPGLSDDLLETQAGGFVGTIGYVPPEQATGRLDEQGPPSDVYGLGAILYTLLAGQSSIKQAKLTDAIRDIETGNFPRPRAVNPRVPPALEAICLHAMKTAPGDRYPTPRALAEDVKHWLADEPVSVYPDSRSERLARWARKNRARAQAAAAALLAVALVSTVAALLVTRSYHHERLARAEAETNFLTAYRAVNKVLFRFARTDLVFLPGAERLRQDLVGDVVLLNEALLRSRPHDEAVLRAIAESEHEAGNIERQTGHYDSALARYDSALDRLRTLAERFPKNEDDPSLRAFILCEVGAVHRTRGQFGQARAVIEKALALAQKLRARAPDDPRFQRVEAKALLDLASVGIESGQFAEAEDQARRAAPLWDKLAAGPQPTENDPGYAIIARTLLAAALREQDRAADALKALTEARGRAEALVKSRDDPDARVMLGGVYEALGDLFENDPARLAECETLYDKAVKIFNKLVEENRSNPSYVRHYTDALSGRGGARVARQMLPGADRDLSAARNTQEYLARQRGLPGDHRAFGRTLAHQARLAHARKNDVLARDLFEKALAELDPKSALARKHRERARKELSALDKRVALD